jgi:hypothetical protein
MIILGVTFTRHKPGMDMQVQQFAGSGIQSVKMKDAGKLDMLVKGFFKSKCRNDGQKPVIITLVYNKIEIILTGKTFFNGMVIFPMAVIYGICIELSQ